MSRDRTTDDHLLIRQKQERRAETDCPDDPGAGDVEGREVGAGHTGRHESAAALHSEYAKSYTR